MPVKFNYRVIYLTPEAVRPAGGMICAEVTPGPLRAVAWNRLKREWVFDPSTVARILSDEDRWERMRTTSRADAEVIAREDLGTELPSEEELYQMAVAGEAATGRQT